MLDFSNVTGFVVFSSHTWNFEGKINKSWNVSCLGKHSFFLLKHWSWSFSASFYLRRRRTVTGPTLVYPVVERHGNRRSWHASFPRPGPHHGARISGSMSPPTPSFYWTRVLKLQCHSVPLRWREVVPIVSFLDRVLNFFFHFLFLLLLPFPGGLSVSFYFLYIKYPFSFFFIFPRNCIVFYVISY